MRGCVTAAVKFILVCGGIYLMFRSYAALDEGRAVAGGIQGLLGSTAFFGGISLKIRSKASGSR